MHAVPLIVKILVTLVLFFGMIMGPAVSSGIIAGLGQDTDRAREGQVMGSWQTRYIIREYKRLNPGGRKHLQAYLAGGIGFAFFLAFAGWLLLLGWS